MPISDTYLVQWLVQETRAAGGGFAWREKETDGYVVDSNGVRIELDHVMSRAGTRRQLTLTLDAERIHILEPASTGVFTEQYANEDAWRLVQLLRELNLAVSRQCAARYNRGEEAMNRIREAVYRRVIGADEVCEDTQLQRLVSR
ncbi:MAG: hypothetical protein ABI972_23590 [Acidobacteriota bacterium]